MDMGQKLLTCKDIFPCDSTNNGEERKYNVM